MAAVWDIKVRIDLAGDDIVTILKTDSTFGNTFIKRRGFTQSSIADTASHGTIVEIGGGISVGVHTVLPVRCQLLTSRRFCKSLLV